MKVARGRRPRHVANVMTPEEPTTRTQATHPEAVDHLTLAEQNALELSGELEHTDGPRAEKLNEKSRKLSDADTENGDS